MFVRVRKPADQNRIAEQRQRDTQIGQSCDQKTLPRNSFDAK
jgi:hypothetical protein